MPWTSPWVAGLVLSVAATSGHAAIYTYSASNRPGASPDANSQSVDVWRVILDGDLEHPDTSGTLDFYPGDSSTNGDSLSSAAGAGTSAWDLHGPLAGTYVSAFASLSDLAGRPLSIAGESVSLQFDNGSLFRPTGDQGSPGTLGINFYEFDSINRVFRIQTSFAIVGTANMPDYQIDDQTAVDDAMPLDTGIPLTADGFDVKLTLLDEAGGYSMDVGNYHSGARPLIEGLSSIAAIEVFTAANGSDPVGPDSRYDLFFNHLSITTVPEASAAVMISTAVLFSGLGGWVVRKLARRAGTPPRASNDPI
jgi:hypothetical protein